MLFEDLSALENWESILDQLQPGRDGVGFGMGDLSYSLMRKDEPDRSAELLAKYVPVIRKEVKERGLLQQNMIWPGPDEEGLKKLAEEGTNVILTLPDSAWFAEATGQYVRKARGLKADEIFLPTHSLADLQEE